MSEKMTGAFVFVIGTLFSGLVANGQSLPNLLYSLSYVREFLAWVERLHLDKRVRHFRTKQKQQAVLGRGGKQGP
jgi:hypothetical protein